jgi:hypothetical protein
MASISRMMPAIRAIREKTTRFPGKLIWNRSAALCRISQSD